MAEPVPASAPGNLDALSAQVKKLGVDSLNNKLTDVKAAVTAAKSQPPSDDQMEEILAKVNIFAAEAAKYAQSVKDKILNGEKAYESALPVLKTIAGDSVARHEGNQLFSDFIAATGNAISGTRPDIDTGVPAPQQSSAASPPNASTLDGVAKLAGRISKDAGETVTDIAKLVEAEHSLNTPEGKKKALDALQAARGHLDEKIAHENFYGSAADNKFRHDGMASTERTIDLAIAAVKSGDAREAHEKILEAAAAGVQDKQTGQFTSAGLTFVARGELIRGTQLDLLRGDAESLGAVKALGGDDAVKLVKDAADSIDKNGSSSVNWKLGNDLERPIYEAIAKAEKMVSGGESHSGTPSPPSTPAVATPPKAPSGPGY